ncbi:unnamed protein product [Caenorhabditis bovis]|uniref:G-protein coupled receptors family 1 profile domain-containing protein n=1 Tax=Caenorhabditis bovis TaxID=2654633 RepID=A0A8S1EJP0_9PELO|nr:unnamed protein product [Caenorhabditis bovis]
MMTPVPTKCTDIRTYLWETKTDLTLHPASIFSFSIIYTFFITLGVFGNLLVVISVCKHKSLQSVRNIFIVSLSCSDIVVSIVSGSVTPITAFSKIWLFGVHLCHLLPLIQGTSLCFSTLTLTAISIDRFILIVYPTKKNRAISLKLRRGILVRGSQKELMTDQRKSALQRRIRTNRMLMAMVGVFFCCWLPSVVFNFLRDYSWLPNFVSSQEYLFGVVTHCISMSSTVCNPCLYALCNEQFRAAFTILLQSVKGSIGVAKNDPSCSQLMRPNFDQSTRRSFVSAVPSSI